MNIYPIVTKNKQRVYEKFFLNNENLKNNIPEICGYYGRACKQMNDKADRTLCNKCTLSLFISTVDAILEQCNEKDKNDISILYDSDIMEIKEKLKNANMDVNISYIREILNHLSKIK